MEDLSQLILDLTQNSIGAKASKIAITIKYLFNENILTIHIKDDGKGMDSNQITNCTSPFYTTRTTRNVGFGLAFAEMLCKQSNGALSINSFKDVGTSLNLKFQLDHWDRPPMGKIEDTFLSLLILNPNLNLILTFENDTDSFYINSDEIKETLEGASITESWAMKWIKEYIKDNINHLVKEDKL